MVEKLEDGVRAADVGCGHGATTVLMAQAFPNSHFVGVDYHDASIATARERAAAAGVGNVSFEVADATTYYRVPAVKDYCRTTNGGKYNCNLYKWAGKFTTDDILKMTDKELQDYEDLWASILKTKE